MPSFGDRSEDRGFSPPVLMARGNETRQTPYVPSKKHLLDVFNFLDDIQIGRASSAHVNGDRSNKCSTSKVLREGGTQ